MGHQRRADAVSVMKTENELIEQITEIIDSTPKSDEFYFIVSRRIIREVITPREDEIKAGYQELIFKVKRELDGKDH